MLDYVIGRYGFFIKTLFSAFGIGYLLRADFDSPIVAYIFIFGAMWSFFRLRTAAHDAFLQSKYISSVLTAFVFWGEHWLDLLMADLSVKGFVGIIIATCGVFILFEEFLNVLYGYCKRLLTGSQHTPILKTYSEKQVFLVSFGMLWGVYFLFFLNQYPGSLSCDTPGQLAQAMGDYPYENANPFINTLVLTLFIKLGLYIGNSVNFGIALYTFFQFSLSALIFAYTVTFLYRVGVNKWFVLFAQIFFNIVPYNIIYANGMWKDTFFAVLFLATFVYICEYIYIYIYTRLFAGASEIRNDPANGQVIHPGDAYLACP